MARCSSAMTGGMTAASRMVRAAWSARAVSMPSGTMVCFGGPASMSMPVSSRICWARRARGNSTSSRASLARRSTSLARYHRAPRASAPANVARSSVPAASAVAIGPCGSGARLKTTGTPSSRATTRAGEAAGVGHAQVHDVRDVAGEEGGTDAARCGDHGGPGAGERGTLTGGKRDRLEATPQAGVRGWAGLVRQCPSQGDDLGDAGLVRQDRCQLGEQRRYATSIAHARPGGRGIEHGRQVDLGHADAA